MPETKGAAVFAGLLRRRSCWVPTWRGWLVLLALVAGLGLIVARSVHPFLALSDPQPGGVLVVEGWAPDYVFAEAVAEFRRGSYGSVCVTGGALDTGAPLSEYKTYAALGEAILVRLGLEPGLVKAVPAPSARQDRTFASAVALRRWIEEHKVAATRINVVSLGAHSRRSRLLFEAALGSGFQVGILSVEDRRYEARRWWRSSAGFRLVMDEVIAYVYTKLFFHPARA